MEHIIKIGILAVVFLCVCGVFVFPLLSWQFWLAAAPTIAMFAATWAYLTILVRGDAGPSTIQLLMSGLLYFHLWCWEFARCALQDEKVTNDLDENIQSNDDEEGLRIKYREFEPDPETKGAAITPQDEYDRRWAPVTRGNRFSVSWNRRDGRVT